MNSETFRAVGNRCAVDFAALELPYSAKEALAILEKDGVRPIEVDMLALARERIGKAVYKRDAKMCDAPDIFNCSTFTKWLYTQKGIWLPRYVVQQSEYGVALKKSDIRPSDLLFFTGSANQYRNSAADGISHVATASATNTIIHASHRGILEEPLAEYLAGRELKAVRRILPHGNVRTLQIPPGVEIEQSDDLRWFILGHLK
ncbi:hypothetical protein A2673_01510 [Candidatus Kaiserbacteria bacterium RIFCSPHIGHO2_01_FULL_50_13]|uniref:NlpC/P60 domain-containing protein n=1 Tax=Candidatus Kaiserbacteria bacterium RIFCSPLOWO2_01_FULL_50_24 TaxID=1798507 RepID=A0A1F6EME7_9BACT|nr:MAG: hypothetical protein A2673_01510 [Candidatus Kaiserbacteria bacterium RIFCSPHIGHO2_01_FULL_50_13]OGG74800.1 MAG: hypothetical protein A3A34_00210 [Candidatus Kaiserbacteria bacterium RIFCSPLOWO2_01_FULL_50_24]OGG81383.1 MAG: hypothetical protein A3H74_02995 [Candidatus Kaiserbacteria bacterium RIFCSPLOWO2_02_FULL_51_13]